MTPLGELVSVWVSCPSCRENDCVEDSSVVVHHDGELLTFACEWCQTSLSVWNGDHKPLGGGRWPSREGES